MLLSPSSFMQALKDTEGIAGIETNGREIIKWVFGIPNNIQVPISKVEMLDVTEGSVSMFRTNIFDQVVVVVKKINEQK